MCDLSEHALSVILKVSTAINKSINLNINNTYHFRILRTDKFKVNNEEIDANKVSLT